MTHINPMASIVHKHMYKSWIQGNPELALERIEGFCREAEERGMMLRYFEDEHYVDIVAAYKESDLEKRYA
jgi:hypothetical protein